MAPDPSGCRGLEQLDCEAAAWRRREATAMSEIDVSGLRIAYEREGTGPPLVLLHGGFGFDSRSWRRQLDALSDEYTVVA